MLQESPKNRQLSKNRKGHPKYAKIKAGTSRTRRMPSKELNQPLTKYTKEIYFYGGGKPK